MAKYNCGTRYNFKKMDGGGMYNSAPYLVMITDYGTAIESVSITADVVVKDSATGVDSVGDVVKTFFAITRDRNNNTILDPLGVQITADSKQDIMPTIIENVETVPGMDGEYDFGSNLGNGKFEFHVVTEQYPSPEEREQIKRIFAKYLNPKVAKPLIFADDKNAKVYNVRYAGKTSISDECPTWFDFVIPFKICSPYVESGFEQQLVGSGDIENIGILPVPIRIEIIGPTVNPSLTFAGETLNYNGTIATGETLIIDTENWTVKIGETNVINNWCKKFPKLAVGTTTVTASDNTTIKWKNRW